MLLYFPVHNNMFDWADFSTLDTLNDTTPKDVIVCSVPLQLIKVVQKFMLVMKLSIFLFVPVYRRGGEKKVRVLTGADLGTTRIMLPNRNVCIHPTTGPRCALCNWPGLVSR